MPPALVSALLVLGLALAAPAAAQAPPPGPPAPGPAPTYRPSTPSPKTLYNDGQAGRFLMDGEWLFRLDPADEGIGRRFFNQRSTAGWRVVSVPHDWTAGDNSVESMNGNVGWYRKDFRLPDRRSGLAWIARFESANYRATVYLNGRVVGEHTGAYLPFEVPLKGLRRGVNRLVVRVDSRRGPQDLPPGGKGSDGLPRGGWWNLGGLNREVYLRRVDRVDLERVRVTPTLPSLSGPAKVNVEATLRNYAPRTQRVRVSGRYGPVRVDLGQTVIGPGDDRVLTRTVRVPRPRLWSPAAPNLYTATLNASAADLGGRGRAGRARRVASYEVTSGIRRIRVNGAGLLELNGRPMDIRGFGLHEDNVVTGAAVTNAIRDNYANWTRELGGTLLRGHYPFSPYLLEQADRKGIMVWQEVPVWSVESIYLQRESVKRAALDQLREMILASSNNPSVFTWSIGNELTSRPGPPEQAWIGTAARTAKELDPTRPVTMALVGYPPDECRTVYEPLDFIGVNTYFGWYPGPVGQSADRELLGPFLDKIRSCYPRKPVMVTEYGAEGNRSGPPEEKGTYEFQDDYVRYVLGVINSKPYVAGAVYWTLQEFRVRPGYTGGNPRGEAPYHQKGPFDRFGNRRPVANLLQQLYSATPPLRGLR